ncbi:unnamed protein product, partial [Sphagnum compactum]
MDEDKLTQLIKTCNNQDLNELKNLIYPLSKQVNEFDHRADSRTQGNYGGVPLVPGVMVEISISNAIRSKKRADDNASLGRSLYSQSESNMNPSAPSQAAAKSWFETSSSVLEETTTPDRSIQMEAQHIQLTNEIEQLKMINAELQTKYRDCSFKLSKSIGLDEHEKQMAEIRSALRSLQSHRFSVQEARRGEEVLERKLETLLEQYKQLVREKEDLSSKL